MNDKTHSALMDFMDLLVNLDRASYESVQEILKVVPKKRRFWPGKPKWRLHLEKVVAGHAAGVDMMCQKSRALLKDLGIEVIAPEINSLFNPRLHRAVEIIPGKNHACIAKVHRYGYLDKEKIIRCADVAVYQ
jgi:hypothetical protein